MSRILSMRIVLKNWARDTSRKMAAKSKAHSPLATNCVAASSAARTARRVSSTYAKTRALGASGCVARTSWIKSEVLSSDRIMPETLA